MVMSTAINDSEEYYCFRMKESINSVDDENIVIPCSCNFDLQKLRMELWKQFGVPWDRRIFYIDDDGDDVPIDSECEFHEALKLAKNAFVANTAIPLIVGSFHVPTSSDDEQCSRTNEIRCKESTSINSNPMLSFIEKNGNSLSEPNPEHFDKQKHLIREIPSTRKKLNMRQCVKLNAEQSDCNDIKTPGDLNTWLRCHTDTVPPPWFTEYMKAMKKDMVSTITHQVVENVTEVLNKRLDSFAYSLKELSQSRNQSYSSLSKRHPRCFFDSNEKTQKRMRSQDEEQSSDASIERVDEPQNVNAAKDPQTTKDVISTISQEVVKEMTEMLNRVPLNPPTSIPSKKLGQSRNQSHFPFSKRFLRHLDSQLSEEKNQRKMRLRTQDGEQSSGDDASVERTYEPRNTANTADMSRQLQKKLYLTEDAICASVLMEEKKKKRLDRIAQIITDNLNSDVDKEQKKKRLNRIAEIIADNLYSDVDKEQKKKRHYRIAQIITDNLNSDVDKEQSTQNNARKDVVSRKNLSLQVDSHDEITGMLENELRMSCSVTGHQILDEDHRTRDVWNSYIDKSSFCSCDQEEDDDDAFEIIQMPTSLGSKNESLTRPEESAADQQRHDSNRDSPSFELLSESPSPTPTCFMHFNEEHFSANEGNAEQQCFQFADTNPPTNSIYVVDIHGKVYNEPQLADLEHVNANLEKRSGGVYSFVAETLPVQHNRYSKSSPLEQRSNEWKKSSRDNMCDTRDNASSTYDDVRNSHTSYLTVWTHCDSKTQRSCQSQTDSNDFTQSFHSHTTSVTDTTDIYSEAYGSGRCDEHVPTTAKNVQEEAAATTTTATTTTTTPRNDYDCVGSCCCIEENKTNERHYNGADNYPKCYCSSYSCNPRGNSVDPPPYQYSRTSGSSDKSSSNAGSKKTSTGTADPIHILPETLVTAAARYVGSYAYDTACEMLDKMRAHTREDSAKR